MIGSVKDRHGIVHLMYIRNEVPYIYSMRENPSRIWCLCQNAYEATVVVGRVPPTCLSCIQLHHGYEWHPMVLE